jgi:hypothetical protein
MHGWNLKLKGSGLRFTGSVGHTGNYVVEASNATDVNEPPGTVNRTLGIRFACFDALQFRQIVASGQSALSVPPTVPPGRRPTAGLVMDLNPRGGVPVRPPDSERLMFVDFGVPRVRGVWKLDVLREDGTALDSRKREGGWGSVSDVMRRHGGGEWTARSMRTVNRLALKLAAAT